MKKHLEFLPLVLLSCYTIKLLVVQTWSFENSIVLMALAGLSAVFQLKAKNDEIKEIRNLLENQSKDIESLKKQDEYLKTSVASMKIAAQSKSQVMKF